MFNYNGSSSDSRTLIKDILHVPHNNVWTGKGMLQEMRDSYAMKHASAYAMLHVLVHERHRLNAP
jgi:hypothetical protein